jgi:hypothetical protein
MRVTITVAVLVVIVGLWCLGYGYSIGYSIGRRDASAELMPKALETKAVAGELQQHLDRCGECWSLSRERETCRVRGRWGTYTLELARYGFDANGNPRKAPR